VVRKAKIIYKSDDEKRVICIDESNYDTISKYIFQDERHIKKFRHIVTLILKGIRNTELYDKEEIDKKSKGVTAMKFFKGQENDRIYCKELRRANKTFIVVCAELLKRKKTKKLNAKQKALIHKVANYTYEIEE